MHELIEKVEKWATEKGILEKGTPVRQALKTLEESQELLVAIIDKNRNEIIDAIGDVMVTIIIQNKMWQNLELDIDDEVHTPFFNSEDNISQAVFVVQEAAEMVEKASENEISFLKDAMCNIIHTLKCICYNENLVLESCLESAYEVIVKRTGKMVNGTFIKDK